MTAIKDMVEYIAKSLADKPEAVEVSESVGEAVIMIEMNVASEDMGRLIGRKGRTINAIRSLARILGAKREKKVNVEII
ncbi:MAG: KH domain-containing protein [Anaerolineae bacterium]